ncbi:MAG: restriction endonuclease subunit S [Ruminococcaceae bacterium]|nr:restriction endonuclease subunit S [Oscillospiraceae bacterium]
MKIVFNKLIDISLNITDGVHNTVIDDANGDCFLLSAKNIKNGLVNFDSTDRKISNDIRTKLNKRTKMSIGDVLFTTVGTLGETALVDENCEKYEFQRSVAIIKPNDKLINNRYLYYLLKSSSYNYYFRSIATGAAQPCIFIGNLGKTKIEYFDDISYQKRIADILSTYDDLIENNNRRIALLEKAAQELYKEWFVRFRFPGYESAEFENGIPVGWEVKKLFDVANVKYGYAFKSDLFCDDEALNPVVRIRDIPNNKTNTYTTEQCDERYLINENSIVIGMDGIFHMCLWNGGKAYLNQRVVEIESKIENLNNLHLYFVLYPQVKYWEQTISGTTVAHLGDKHLKKLSVILPSEDICKKAKNFFDSIMLQKSALFKQNENLIKQRDLLLPRLMSGKLEV